VNDASRRPLPFAVRVHPQFLHLFFLLLAFVALRGDGFEAVLRFSVGFVVTTAGLLLHELGHAFAARRYGIVVDEVVIHPLGGMAKLLWRAEDPGLEMRVAFAGPAVNLALAAASWGALQVVESRDATWFAAVSLGVNLVVGAGNLLPAFPMDGGRILRAALSRRIGRAEATRVAARIGRAIGALFFVAPFVLWKTTDLPFLALLSFPLVGLTIVALGEWERLKALAEERMGAAAAAAGAPSGGVGRGPSGEGPGDVVEASGSSRVVE
jgi:Zn-dependent protease